MITYTLDDRTDMRLLEPGHTDELYRLTEDNQLFLRRWFAWAAGIGSAYDSRAFIDELNRRKRIGDAYGYGLFENGRLAGVLELSNVNSPDKAGRIGYWLSKPAHGRGRMTQACAALTNDAFERCGLNRVVIQAAVDNKGGRAVPERLGFTLEGIAREAKRLDDRFVDMAVYSMLASEWAEMKQLARHVGY